MMAPLLERVAKMRAAICAALPCAASAAHAGQKDRLNLDTSAHAGAWMLIAQTHDGVLSIKTGMTQNECVTARWAVDRSAQNPSMVRRTYQVPNPNCLGPFFLQGGPDDEAGRCWQRMGLSWGRPSFNPVMSRDDFRSTQCVNTTTGDTATTLAVGGPPSWP